MARNLFNEMCICNWCVPSLTSNFGSNDLYKRSLGGLGKKLRTCVMKNRTYSDNAELPGRLGLIGIGVVGMELGPAMQAFLTLSLFSLNSSSRSILEVVLLDWPSSRLLMSIQVEVNRQIF